MSGVDTPPNAYSSDWLETFLFTVPAEQTEAEAAFLARHLPLPTHRALLDVGCGAGRHALALARRGYDVLGVDRSAAALAEARRHGVAGARFVLGDMTRLEEVPGPFDGVLFLWQSFGYFDEETNERVLAAAASHLTPRGRVVLDLYHPGFFAAHQGVRAREHAGRSVEERKRLDGDRLTVELRYGGSATADVFEWRLYTPEEIGELGARSGLELRLACAAFDERVPAGPAHPRMQLVLEAR